MPPKKPRKEWTRDTSYKTHEGSYAFQMELPEGGGEPKGGKRKVAMTVGYCGTGFQGMQMNKGVRTVEAELEHALFKANLISAANFGNLNKINWSKAARTDKGVHAAAQVVACKLCIRAAGGEGEDEQQQEGGKKEEGEASAAKQGEGGKEEEGEGGLSEANMLGVMEAINAQLPEAIRVLDMVRSSKPFDARKMCDRRRYVYMLPTFCLMDEADARAIVQDCWPQGVPMPAEKEGNEGGEEGKEDGNKEGEGKEAAEEGGENGGGGEQANGAAAPGEEGEEEGQQPGRDGYEQPDPSKLPACFERLRGYRVTPERLESFRQALRSFVGNRRFHNFSSKVEPKSSQAWRILQSVEAGDPFVSEADGVEWVAVTLQGVSFLLNMIRKVVAAAVDVSRGVVSESQLQPAFEASTRMIVPMAPADGLYLKKAIFEQYDSRQTNTPQERRMLDWESDEAAKARVEAFEKQHILPHILAKESECQPFTRWLYNLSFGSQGAYVAVPIPPSEQRGEKRDSWGGRKGKGGRQQDEDEEEAVEE